MGETENWLVQWSVSICFNGKPTVNHVALPQTYTVFPVDFPFQPIGGLMVESSEQWKTMENLQ